MFADYLAKGQRAADDALGILLLQSRIVKLRPLSTPCEIQQGQSNRVVDHGNEGDTEKTCLKMCISEQQASAKLTAVPIKQNEDTPDPGHSRLVREIQQ